MTKRLVPAFALVLIIGLSVGASTTQPIDIAVSPQSVNLQFQGEWVTVHANILFSLVVPDSVALDGFPADIEKYDDRGYLVAKFKMTKMEDYHRGFLDEGRATLTLTGATIGGGSFSGSDTVRVIDEGGGRNPSAP